MSENVPTYHPPSNDYYGPVPERVKHADHTDDFTSLMPARRVPATDPTNIPAVMSEHQFLTGEVPPDVYVVTPRVWVTKPALPLSQHVDSGQHRASSQAGLASFAPQPVQTAEDVMEAALGMLGTPPGAAHYAARNMGSDVEAAMDRARAFEVIALAAVAFVGAPTVPGRLVARDALFEAVRENRAAIS